MTRNIISSLIDENHWLDIPREFTTREGHVIQTAGDIWDLPISYRSGRVSFGRVENPILKWAAKRRVMHSASVTSMHAAIQDLDTLRAEFFSKQLEFGLSAEIEPKEIKHRLISLIEGAISKARTTHRLWALYRPIQWYIWCADQFGELGFCSAYALELDGMIIPGNPKGEAVRMEDPDRGPLHRSLELPLIIDALKNDRSENHVHQQQKAAMALSIALGRNPANLTFLKESDLINLNPAAEPCYIIKMPRIKKRQLHPRDDLMDEYLDAHLAKYVAELISANRTFVQDSVRHGRSAESDRPLFFKVRPTTLISKDAGQTPIRNMTSSEINTLIQDFVRRHGIISPLTGQILNISTRRLRYTLATCLAAEGISRKELAKILDHTDTQHVQVYFELAGSIVEHLDKATAKGFAKYLQLFKGKIIDGDTEATNGDRIDKHLAFVNELNPKEHIDIGICGERTICHLDPPFSCYLCPKFQPYRHADHENVLECLLASRADRMEKYENARLGIQLDQVIVAVAQVAEQCKREANHG